MQKLVLLGLAAVTLFAVSAGTSWYLRSPPPPPAEAPAVKRALPGNAATSPPSSPLPPGGPPLRPAVRHPYNPEAESTLQSAASLNRQRETLRAREQLLAARQKSVELAYQDVRGERAVIDELRKKLNEEVAALEAKLSVLEQQAGNLSRQQAKTARQIDELKKATLDFEGVEQGRVKQLAAVYDAMAPASAAKILQQMADTGSLDTAVKILALMKERQAAKVLAELPDSNLAAQLLEKLKGLKRPAPAAKK